MVGAESGAERLEDSPWQNETSCPPRELQENATEQTNVNWLTNWCYPVIEKFLRFLLNPSNLFFKAWQAMPVGSYKLRLDYDVFPRPHYAFCTYHAARLADLLGIERISLVEFGVAGGNGLVELERLAELVEQEFKVRIDIYGFDSGMGLPAPQDYRDLPYVWQEGFFKMDVDSLKSRLKRSKLILGDVKDTVPTFFEEHSPAPIAATFHDLDYYSSTRDALRIHEGDSKWLLPRIYCYCDDVYSSEMGGILCDRVGQLCAINEYNEQSPARILAPIAGFPQSRRRPATWNEKIYVHHDFDHPQYNTYVHPNRDRQLQLK